jgi:hypothetical protein
MHFELAAKLSSCNGRCNFQFPYGLDLNLHDFLLLQCLAHLLALLVAVMEVTMRLVIGSGFKLVGEHFDEGVFALISLKVTAEVDDVCVVFDFYCFEDTFEVFSILVHMQSLLRRRGIFSELKRVIEELLFEVEDVVIEIFFQKFEGGEVELIETLLEGQLASSMVQLFF